jgi:hypothetical protein
MEQLSTVSAANRPAILCLENTNSRCQEAGTFRRDKEVKRAKISGGRPKETVKSLPPQPSPSWISVSQLEELASPKKNRSEWNSPTLAHFDYSKTNPAGDIEQQ